MHQTTYGLFSTYHVFNKINFDYLTTYYQVLLDQEMEQTLMLLTLDILSYNLLGLNRKIPSRSLSRDTLGKYSGPIYGNVNRLLSYIYIEKSRHIVL